MKPKPALYVRSYTRPSLAESLAHYVERQITACQEWLEGPDRPLSLFLAAAVVMLFLAYLLYHLISWLCSGG